LGRVWSVGRDYRTGVESIGSIAVEVQTVYQETDFTDAQKTWFQPPLLLHELVLSWNETIHLVEGSIIVHMPDIRLDYAFQDEKLNQSHRPTQEQLTADTSKLFLRRIIDDVTTLTPNITPPCLSNPSRGELELQAFGRAHLGSFDTTLSNRKTVSLPLLTFIDGFGLYRNAYRSLMGIYCIPTGLTFKERTSRVKVSHDAWSSWK
jgi:hypothetical protein